MQCLRIVTADDQLVISAIYLNAHGCLRSSTGQRGVRQGHHGAGVSAPVTASFLSTSCTLPPRTSGLIPGLGGCHETLFALARGSADASCPGGASYLSAQAGSARPARAHGPFPACSPSMLVVKASQANATSGHARPTAAHS